MGQIHLGPKHFIQSKKDVPVKQVMESKMEPAIHIQREDPNLLVLKNKISELETQLQNKPKMETIFHKIEVPVETFIEKKVEVFVDRIVEVIKEVEVKVEKIVHVPVEVLSEKVIEKIVVSNPKWVYYVMGIELLAIVLMYFK